MANNYKDLQEQAKALGLPYTGVSREELEQSIKDAKNTSESSGKSEPKEDTESEDKKKDNKPTEEEVKAKEKEDKESDENESSVAIVKSGSTEVRRYTREDHGEDFEALANEFASKKNYSVSVE